ncbi:MAG: hypothetical protein E7343_05100 [Clostridiales bacterium]|nr:hypothetical protein [Clostridiales bacterium]
MKRAWVLVFSFALLFMFSSCLKNSEDLPILGQMPNESETEDGGNIPNEAETYIVVFDSNGGTEIQAQTVKKGEAALKPKNPSRANTSTKEYTFKGWYLGDKEWDFDEEITENITLVAKWEVTQYTVEMLPSK